jgi:hypothetical protein
VLDGLLTNQWMKIPLLTQQTIKQENKGNSD